MGYGVSDIFNLSCMCMWESVASHMAIRRQLLGITSFLPPYWDRISLVSCLTSHLSGGILGLLCVCVAGFWGQNLHHQVCTVNSVTPFTIWAVLPAPKFSLEWLRKTLCTPGREWLRMCAIVHIKACGRYNCVWLCMSCCKKKNVWVGGCCEPQNKYRAQSGRDSWIQVYVLFFFQYLCMFFKSFQAKGNILKGKRTEEEKKKKKKKSHLTQISSHRILDGLQGGPRWSRAVWGRMLHNGLATPGELYSSRANPLNTHRPKSYFYMAHI